MGCEWRGAGGGPQTFHGQTGDCGHPAVTFPGQRVVSDGHKEGEVRPEFTLMEGPGWRAGSGAVGVVAGREEDVLPA